MPAASRSSATTCYKSEVTAGHPFDVETAVRAAGPGLWKAHTSKAFWGGGGPHGGHLGATLLKAMIAETADPELAPRSFTVHYTAPAEEGELEVEARTERRGRSVATLSGRMTQAGNLVALGLGALARPRPGPEFAESPLPEMPGPEDLAGPSPRARERTPQAMRNYEFRFAIGKPFSGGAPRGGGWVRPLEPRLADAAMVFNYTDIWMPAVFMKFENPAWVPTIELTVNFFAELPLPDARPDDWYAVLFEAPVAEGGYWREEGSVWSRDGRLLARSSQLSVFLSAP